VIKVRQVDELAGEVAAASREQSQGIEQVNTAVSQMDKVTQANAASAEESASASAELSAQAETMREAVRDLLRLVDQSAAGQGANSRSITGGGAGKALHSWSGTPSAPHSNGNGNAKKWNGRAPHQATTLKHVGNEVEELHPTGVN
jgi:hypothetical protein